MADQVYLIPGVGLYKDTEQNSVKLVPGGGLYKEQAATGAEAAITGTATDGVLESEIVTGGETIIITLTNDTFVTGTVSEDAIAAGMNGSASWNSEVRDNTDNTNIVLSVGDTVATVTLPAAAGYTISANDTITVTIPAASLTTSSAAVVATPTFAVTNEAVGGSIVVLRRRILEIA